ncbi:alkaline phosphatase family protein [Nigerium massiliense]|uniref:alkaline phosphatase family protein n=1 Tax=Nigerium massiliense TaxID=1522317 RepID=UPI000907BBD6|nr:alkaline phosphatase family protein [Nigerium massiliense]
MTFNLRPRRAIAAGALALTVTAGVAAYGVSTGFGQNKVGQETPAGLQASDNQVLKPLGNRLVTEYGKFMGSTVSPNGRFLAASAADRNISLQIFDLKANKLIWRAGRDAGANLRLTDGSVGQESPTYSPDGKFLWLSQNAALTRFPVNADGTLGTPVSFPLAADGKKLALPGKVTYSPDGGTLYVAVNGQNKVAALDPNTGAVKRTWNVGIAPREVVFVGDKLYVSNEGGRPARPGEATINSYGTDVPANTFLGTSTTGTLSVIDPSASGDAVKSIDVGLHPTAMLVHEDVLFVANTNSDTVSVVDTTKNKVVQTINTQPYSNSSVGYAPTALAMTRDGRLLVTLGRVNAVAVYRYANDPMEPVSYIGLLPTDYYPSDIAVANGKVVVTNTRGIDARGPEVTINKGYGTNPATGHGTHSTTGSLTSFAMPNDKVTRQQTKVVFEQNDWQKNDVKQARGKKQKAVPVPQRIGDPSTIKHVFLIVKENRTYDQMYGDMPQGNGDPSLAQFGQVVTPNQHALANQFGLFDNVYDIGTNSAEGHNWLMQGDDPEYTEHNNGAYQRSYDTEDDVLGHQRSGFLWTSAEQAGKNVRNYGEFIAKTKKPAGATWQKYYCAAKDVINGGDPAQLTAPQLKLDAHSPIASLEDISLHTFPQFDTDIPDIYRVQLWKQEFEKRGPSALNMFWLSSDHTGGPVDARAQVADSDLATGQMVDEISHSKYWRDSVIFVVEDDSQDGVDHVDGHRAPVQVISPWAKHGVVNSTYYSQINMIRTIQQILGAQPLNQKLAAATPMYDAFTNKPNYSRFATLPNQVPLTENVKDAPACGPDVPGTLVPNAKAPTSAALPPLPAKAKSLAKQWEQWRVTQPFVTEQEEDEVVPPLMNRFTWYQAHNFSTPYPGDKVVYAPKDVPGVTAAQVAGTEGEREKGDEADEAEGADKAEKTDKAEKADEADKAEGADKADKAGKADEEDAKDKPKK